MSVLCIFGIHNYEMFKLADKKGRFFTMGRCCKWCSKRQFAVRPEKYHPSLYIWQDEKE